MPATQRTFGKVLEQLSGRRSLQAFLPEEFFAGSNPSVRSMGDDSCGADWRSAGLQVHTDDSLVDGKAGSTTESEHFFVGAVRKLFVKEVSAV